MLRNFIMLVLLAGTTALANAAPDVQAGAEAYKRCVFCHSDDKGGGDGLGPNLFGIVGSKAASRPGFTYSAPLLKSGIVWTPANLTKWLAGPGRMVPGTSMAFAGVTSKSEQASLVAYLASQK